MAPPFLLGAPRFYVDSTIDAEPDEDTWQTNSLILPPRFRGGARSCISIQRLPQGKLFAARWKGTIKVNVEPASGNFSLHLSVGGGYRFQDGKNVICSEPDLLVPPDAVFNGSFKDLSLLFVDIARESVERANGGNVPDGIGLRALPARHGKNLRSVAFAIAREADHLPPHCNAAFLRSFQNVMAAALVTLLRDLCPDAHKPAPMIGRRTVAELCEWAALDHHDPVTVGDIAARCGLGLRALQKNFLRHFDTTPYLWLRNLRLDRSRKLIETGDFTVTEAAVDAGFSHFGHFTAAYREKFGELPSATLLRTHNRS